MTNYVMELTELTTIPDEDVFAYVLKERHATLTFRGVTLDEVITALFQKPRLRHYGLDGWYEVIALVYVADAQTLCACVEIGESELARDDNWLTYVCHSCHSDDDWTLIDERKRQYWEPGRNSAYPNAPDYREPIRERYVEFLDLTDHVRPPDDH